MFLFSFEPSSLLVQYDFFYLHVTKFELWQVHFMLNYTLLLQVQCTLYIVGILLPVLRSRQGSLRTRSNCHRRTSHGINGQQIMQTKNYQTFKSIFANDIDRIDKFNFFKILFQF